MITFVVSLLIWFSRTFTSFVNSFIEDFPGDLYIFPIISFGWFGELISIKMQSYNNCLSEENEMS